jgi:ElaB/YqjD/DUF883 family membrane-anchored ribosome-binding protein
MQTRAIAAETPDEAARFAKAFSSLARSVRQSLALEAKLEREARREAIAAEDEAASPRARVKLRKAQVREAIERLVWSEHEKDEAEEILRRADTLITEAAWSSLFTMDPVGMVVDRIVAKLGLRPVWVFEDEDDEEDEDEDLDDPPILQSSA